MKMRASHHSIHLSAFHLKDCINQVASRLRKKSTVPIWGHQYPKTEHSVQLANICTSLKVAIWKRNQNPGFVPFITTWNVAWRQKNVITTFQEGSDGIPQALSSLGNRSPFSLLKNPLKKTLLISSLRPLLTNLQFSKSFFSFLQFKMTRGRTPKW